MAGGAAFAQQADQAPVKLERVEITGSSIKRTDISGALPVQTVTREDIQKLGVTSTEALLNAVTANTAVGGTTTAQGVGAQTFGEATASLRGLGQSRTLVLVNGRRLANYATDGTAVDINTIPLSAVDRVEVLKDGASGVYGSDAVAGVINFILRNNFQGFEASGYAGSSTDGGGASTKAGFVAGFGNFDTDRYNIVLSADFGHDSEIKGSQRTYANKSWSDAGIFDSSATPSGALRTFDPTTAPNANGIIPNSLKTQGKSLDNPLSPNNCAQNGSAYDPNFPTCRYNPSPIVPLVPDVKRASFSGSFRFRLTEQDEFFLEGFFANNVTTTSEQPSPYSVAFLASDTAFVTKNIYPAIILAPTSPFYPTSYLSGTAAAGKPVTVSFRAFDGGGRVHTDTAQQAHLVSGIRGTLKEYDYDLAFSHDSSNVSESTQGGYQSQTALASLLSNNSAFNPFTQYQTPALAAQIAGTNYNGPMIDATYTADALNGKISGELFKLPAGPLSFAVGGALRDERMAYNPSAAFQSGDISGYGSQALPLTKSRNSSSIFGELDATILKSLEADLSVRYDKYPNVTSTNPKLSLRFQPLSQILIRGSYGTGFREPSLPELYTPQVSGTTANFRDPVTNTKGQFTQLTGGNPNLKPEKSDQWSLGFVADPGAGVSLSVDYFNIRVKNIVQALDPQFIVGLAAAGNPQYTGLVQRDGLQNITQITSTNLNAGELSTSGFDVDLKWRIAKSERFGTFDANLNGTYLTKFSETLADGTIQPSIGQSVDSAGNNLNAVAAGGIIFRWRHELTLGWGYGPYGASVTQHYQSGYDDNIPCCTVQTTPNHVSSFSTWDLQGSYAGFKHIMLRLGVKNVANRQPPLAITLGQYFQAGYDPSYYDAHGRFVYATASYKF